MQFLTRFSLRNPVAVVILVLIVAVAGVLSALGLKEDLMPDLSVPVLSVVTTYPGASPSQVTTDISEPLEKALNGAQDVQTINSTSVAGVSQIELQLNMNANVNTVSQNVTQILNQVQLPSTAGQPQVKSFSFSDTPVLEFTVGSSQLSSEHLKSLVNNTVLPALQGVSGVAAVNAAGADADGVLLTFHAKQLAAHHVNMEQVLQVLQSDNVTTPLGTATVSGKVQPVQLDAGLNSLGAIRSLPIPVTSGIGSSASSFTSSLQALQFGRGAGGGLGSRAGLTKGSGGATSAATSSATTIQLSDVATVKLAPPAATSINRTNGQPSILITVTKTNQANTVDVAHRLNQALSKLKVTLGSGVSIVSFFDASQMITASVHGVMHEAVLGAIFAVVVILFFLRNFRTTLVAVVSIPISILTATILLSKYGVTLNIMTLGGLAVATGRVVDDSIVVIENIYRTWKAGEGFGKDLVLKATAEVGNAILSSTLATIAVFLPLALVGGLVGKIFFPFSLTVVCALASSFIVALTVVPMLAWLFVVRKPVKATRIESIRPWQRRYQSILNSLLNHKGWVLVLTTLIFVASVAVLPLVGATFLQNSMQPSADVSITLPVGTPLATTDNKATAVTKALRTLPGVTNVDTSVGGSGNGFQPQSGSNQAMLYVALSANTDVNQFLTKARERVAPLKSSGTTIQVQGQATGGGGSVFDWVVTGPNQTDIQTATNEIVQRLKSVPGLANVESNLSKTQPKIQVVPNLAKVAKAGLTAQEVASDVRAYMSSQTIGTVNLGGQSYNLDITLVNGNSGADSLGGGLNTLADIRALPLQGAGSTLTLGDVATVSSVPTPTAVLHQNGQDYGEVTADYTVQNTSKPMQLAKKAIDHLHLPSNVTVAPSSSALQQTQSFTQLIEAILVAVGIVYIVMLILFGEWSAPFAILFSMPVALIGAFLGTWVAHQPLSVSSLIGILMLMGIVVTNAIVLVQRVEQQRALGMTVREALLEAGSTRLRPILMTAVATICALLPLAVGASEGVLISQGLAVVVIGGLVTSTILTLCIVPIMYELLHRRVIRREQRRRVRPS